MYNLELVFDSLGFHFSFIFNYCRNNVLNELTCRLSVNIKIICINRKIKEEFPGNMVEYATIDNLKDTRIRFSYIRFTHIYARFVILSFSLLFACSAKNCLHEALCKIYIYIQLYTFLIYLIWNLRLSHFG